MDWDEYPEGEDPEALTGISGMCSEGNHLSCGGIVALEGREGEVGRCVCPCHGGPAGVQ
jgi:hypothetical protein